MAAKQKIAILGAGGMIGSKLARYLSHRDDLQFLPLTYEQLDVTNKPAMREALRSLNPDWVVYAAAFLGPDQCHKEPLKSYAVNYQGVADLAEILVEMQGPKLIHFSSDFIFDGTQGGYTEQDVGLPVNYYGLHKYFADEAIRLSGVDAYVLRIASVIGAEGPLQRDFLKAILGRVAGGAEKLSVIEEYQISTSTPKFLAWVIGELLTKRPAFGLYNSVASGVTSWRALAIAALDELGIKIPVDPIAASAFPTPAARPPKTWLKTDKLSAAIGKLPDWESVIRAQVRDLKDAYLEVAKKK